MYNIRAQKRFRPFYLEFYIRKIRYDADLLYNIPTDEDPDQIQDRIDQTHRVAEEELREAKAEQDKWIGILREVDEMVEALFLEKQVVWPKLI